MAKEPMALPSNPLAKIHNWFSEEEEKRNVPTHTLLTASWKGKLAQLAVPAKSLGITCTTPLP
ncbi:hypothetical protein BDM02DRAFT_3107093 [Thelephora ganbajun]|uniref:Uncharacterized protein n=1 Tax=Thelephora ganbajun TaxID=370292 RepID=A0ACB6ZWG8_THEGA|nr:hypothetical protein BDM02DRAFT_3107093 [Thelephora ganbajun]